ncbi:MAG: hypothetical protein ACR2HH_08840 [Chthoniobacterales bacterium]
MFGLVWMTAVAVGLRTLLNYEGTPGTVATLPTNWPAQSAIKLSSAKPTLLVFTHPHCSRTQATNGRADWDDTPLRTGKSAIVSLVNHQRSERARTLVSGCSRAGHLQAAPQKHV